ncbi:conserved hypothetical protein [Tenacibaculum sp. 190524A05c]|uniref:hypothetical protein n=1 Tax=Tenacibaculum platacis TaxID=3137852 RepID=UPI0031FA9658
MKKIIVQIATTALLLANISCSDENEVVTEKDITIETSSDIITELPKNVISAEEFLAQNSFKFKNTIKESQRLGGDLGTGTYRKMFVVFPPDWNYSKRLNYLNLAKNFTVRDIYLAVDICEFVDTWYIEVLTTDPIDKNKRKNVIEASATNVDPDDTMESDDGPGATGDNIVVLKSFGYYNNCDEIPLPPEYSGVIFDTGSGNSGSGNSNGGPNEDPNGPQQ